MMLHAAAVLVANDSNDAATGAAVATGAASATSYQILQFTHKMYAKCSVISTLKKIQLAATFPAYC